MATDTVAEVKARLSIQDIISPYVKLRRAGRSLVGLCPFHKEKTGSFHVSTERGSWHCFGCGLGGDGFTFIEKIEGVDFKGALKILAEKAGVKIEYSGRSPEDTSKKERLRALMNRASEWYAAKLPKSPAETYAKERALTPETIETWRLGYAADEWRALLEALMAEGFTVEEMLSAGLIKEADGKKGTYYDRFRNRLMFPIRDSAGRVVAFTGRILPQTKPGKEEVEPAKYLNSPETELYHKSEILFAMDMAKDAIRTRGFTCLMEGQMDVLHAHQAGFKNAVALSGTALTPTHLSLMKRYSENLMLVLDADAAGMKATARSAELALQHGLRVKAVRLPEGKDPADLISEDSKEFAKRLSSAKPIVEFFIAELSEKEKDSHRLLRLAEGIVLPLIAAIQSPMERDHFIQSAARALSLSPEAVAESVKRVPKQNAPEYGVENVGAMKESPRRKSAVETRTIQLLAILKAYPDTPLANQVKSRYLHITEARALPTLEIEESALFEAEQTYGENPGEGAADELIHAFEHAVIREAYEEAVGDLRRAEASGDANAIEQAQQKCATLSARLASFGH